MQSSSSKANVLALILLCLTHPPSAKAAHFTIDDFSVPGQITAVAGDFEYGVTINGNFTEGLGNVVNVTAAASAGPMTFSGSWIDDGASTPGSFAQVSADDALIYQVSTGAVTGGKITGEFCPSLAACTIPADAVVSDVGEGPNIFNQAFLTASWQSDPVPEPAGILLFGAILAGLFVARRRRPTWNNRCR